MMIAIFLLLVCMMVLQFIIIWLKLKETDYQMSMHTDIMKELGNHKQVFVDHVEDKEESIRLKREILDRIERIEPVIHEEAELTKELWKNTFTPLSRAVHDPLEGYPQQIEVDIDDPIDTANLAIVKGLDLTLKVETEGTDEQDQ